MELRHHTLFYRCQDSSLAVPWAYGTLNPFPMYLVGDQGNLCWHLGSPLALLICTHMCVLEAEIGTLH